MASSSGQDDEVKRVLSATHAFEVLLLEARVTGTADVKRCGPPPPDLGEGLAPALLTPANHNTRQVLPPARPPTPSRQVFGSGYVILQGGWGPLCSPSVPPFEYSLLRANASPSPFSGIKRPNLPFCGWRERMKSSVMRAPKGGC